MVSNVVANCAVVRWLSGLVMWWLSVLCTYEMAKFGLVMWWLIVLCMRWLSGLVMWWLIVLWMSWLSGHYS